MRPRNDQHNRNYKFLKIAMNRKEYELMRRAMDISETFIMSEYVRSRTIDAAKRELDDYFWHSPELRHIPWEEAIPRLLQAYPPSAAAPSIPGRAKRS